MPRGYQGKVLPPGGPLRSSQGEKKGHNESLLVRRARVANIIVDLANGMTMKAVAEKYQVSKELIRRDLRFAEREGFFEKAEDAIAHRLVPLAIDVYERALRKHLETGDYDAAEKLLKGVRLFSSGATRQDMPRPTGLDEDEASLDWEEFTAQRARRLNEVNNEYQPTASPQSDARRGAQPESVPAIDAEVVSESDGEGRVSADAEESEGA